MNLAKEKELAKIIVAKSLKILPRTEVYIKYKSEESIKLLEQLTLEIRKRGGFVYTHKYNKELEDFLLSMMSYDSIDSELERQEFENKKYDIFISIGSNDEFVKTPKENREIIDEYKRRKMQLEKFKTGKQWLLLNYPSIVDANNMGMAYDDYYNYAMDAMAFNFDPLLSSIMELKELLAKTEKVKIVGDNVNLEFYKNNIPAVELIGSANLPDGEIYTSPIRDSAKGFIKYNVPSPKNGLIFEDIMLRFNNGKVVDYSCKDYYDEFAKLINIDEGARYIGEFAFGFNPVITKPMNDILYDEKLCRSFHIALGNAYSNAYNGNSSALHWDMIYLNQPYNYCDIYFNNELVYSKGLFIPAKIRKLNK